MEAAVPKEHNDEVVIVHHFTSTPDKLQLEVERRWTEDGSTKLSFERIYL